MRIAIFHNYYMNSGGEDVVVQNEISILKKNGHDVKLFAKDNKNIVTLIDKVVTAINLPYSKSAFREAFSKLKLFRPDIVHIHNFFMLWSPSIIYACNELNIPVIFTLHNFRLISPNALLFFNGQIDDLPIKRSAYHCVWHGCYHNSKMDTFWVARMIEYHKKSGTWQRRVSKFIALSDFTKEIFIQSGFPSAKIVTKPNFIDIEPNENHTLCSRAQFTYVGRLSEEKGISVLISAFMKISVPLKIIGYGPMEPDVYAATNISKNIEYLGPQLQENIIKQLKQSIALIFPSLCYEGFPMVILEAFSQSTPVISSNIGSQASIIKDGYNGLHFNSGSVQDLIDKVKLLSSDENLQHKLGLNAVNDFKNQYTSEPNYQKLISIYQSTLHD